MNIGTPLSSAEDSDRKLAIEVPLLLSIIRYIDDYTDEDHKIDDPFSIIWHVTIDGAKASLKFDRYENDPALQRLIQAFIADLFLRAEPSTVRLYLGGLAHLAICDIISAIECDPKEIRDLWNKFRPNYNQIETFVALKCFLSFLAERKICGWSSLYLPFISSSLPLPPKDKFAAIRRGDVFIPVEDEAKLVRWIENCCLHVDALPLNNLIDAALIICNYQFGMRPKQIGMIRRRDCRIVSTVKGSESIHLTFRMIKQLDDAKKKLPLVRRVKRDWAIIFVNIIKRSSHTSGAERLFGYASAQSVALRIRELLLEITQAPWTATDLRHSAAMRLVDAGASAEELAEFMGHSSLKSGQSYYTASATQAERVNQALGISDTYRQVEKFGSRFISKDELAKLKGINQVAGIPHGIPIAGIGACTTGQPSCPYNPVTACYGCPKFLPLADASIHLEVLSSFREVVNFFYSSSRGDSNSPAYLQLKITISEVQDVINNLKTDNAL